MDAPANFGSRLPPEGVNGVLVRADPLDACEPLDKALINRTSGLVWFAVVERSVALCGFAYFLTTAQRTSKKGAAAPEPPAIAAVHRPSA